MGGKAVGFTPTGKEVKVKQVTSNTLLESGTETQMTKVYIHHSFLIISKPSSTITCPIYLMNLFTDASCTFLFK